MKLNVALRIVVLTLIAVKSLHCQESVCKLFADLKGANGKQLVLTGDLIISKSSSALGSAICDYRYTAPVEGVNNMFPTALHLRPSPAVTPAQLKEFQNAGIEADRLRAEGKVVRASGSFSGLLRVAPVGTLPAELTFDSFNDLRVETLPAADSLPVVPICELFQNLSQWSGKRIAVRGEVVATFEGSWIRGHCKGAFYTNEHRWPTGLSLGVPAYQSYEYEKLYEPTWPPLAKGASELSVSTTATLVGILNMRSEYHLVCLRNGKYLGNGFGHLNSAAGELLVDTVLNVEVNQQTEESIPSKETEQRCVPSASVPLWP
jgi:hypothetical protein